MPVFKCSKCSCVENTAVCNYWVRAVDKEPPLCSACDPKIGKWHGLFLKMPADGMVEEGGFLVTIEEAAMKAEWKRTVEGLDTIKHVGTIGMLKYAFERGWNHGADHARRDQGPPLLEAPKPRQYGRKKTS